MKKIVTMLLALALVAAMSVPAFAAMTMGKESKTIDVEAKYSDSVDTPTVYSVDVTWESMQFTFAASGSNTWNPADHSYNANVNSGWEKSTSDITVVNHSNTAVKATFAFVAAENSGITGSFNNNGAVSLPSAENKAVDAAELTGTVTFTIDGVPSAGTMTKVGTITVTIQ